MGIDARSGEAKTRKVERIQELTCRPVLKRSIVKENPFALPRYRNVQAPLVESTVEVQKRLFGYLHVTYRYGLVVVYSAVWTTLFAFVGAHFLLAVYGVLESYGLLSNSEFASELLPVALLWLFAGLGLAFGWLSRQSRRWHTICFQAGTVLMILFGFLYDYLSSLPVPPRKGWFSGLGHSLAILDALGWVIAAGLIVFAGMIGWLTRRAYNS